MLKGKRLSILGDSISTYRGVSNDAAACASTKYNQCYYREPFPLGGTYWRVVMDRLGLELAVNNSYSGGNLSGRDNPDSGVMRAQNLSRDDGISPDLVIVFMGINDLGRGVCAEVFQEDYLFALETVKKNHPSAAVCCVNLPDRDIFLTERARIFNAAISDAVNKLGKNFFLADLFSSRLRGDFYYMNTLDGLHPDEDGMRHIADVVESAIKAHYGIE